MGSRLETFILIIVAAFTGLSLRAADITFADAAVKALCVANWDTNNDGELSIEEAAAVKSLGEVFRGNKEIGTFGELKYFTGLTAIDEYAFSESSISGELRVPGNVKAIKNYAFNTCRQLTAVVLEEGVETVGWHSFSGPIRLLSLPTSLTFMSSMAIDPYVNSSSSGIFTPEGDLYVYVRGTTPASINNYAFYYIFADAHLVVPHGCVEAYKSEKAWSQFGEYIEVGDVNRDGKLNVADIALLIAYVTGREYTEIEALIADVNGDGAVDANDVKMLCRYVLGITS